MQIGVVKESAANEFRVAASPTSIQQLIKLNFSVVVESGAGEAASFSDAMMEAAGATIVDGNAVWQSDFVLKVNAPTEDELSKLKSGAILVGFFFPAQNEALMKSAATQGINILAMDAVPRISRAQSMDALSSMANIAGYRAVIEASHEFGSFFTGQITAAGKVPPAKVMVIGAGVAGLAALGTAGSLGAIVRAFDTRPEVKEQIESMGGEFLELDFEEEEAGSGDGYAKVMSKAFIEAEMALFAEQAKEVDIIITTAMIPGKPAPKLITREMVESMKPGSVIVDLAAAGGGNCEATVPDQSVMVDGVHVIGYTDMPSRLPTQASQLYANNILNLIKLLCPEKDGNIELNFDDEIIRNVTVTKSGEVTWPPPPVQVSAAPKIETKEPLPKPEPKKPGKSKAPLLLGLGAIGYGWMSTVAPAEFMQHFSIFILACIIGYYVVWNVSHALHTPLMSVTNAISGIIVVGALLQISSGNTLVLGIATFAVLIAFINVVGGFVVTKRMLRMFRKED